MGGKEEVEGQRGGGGRRGTERGTNFPELKVTNLQTESSFQVFRMYEKKTQKTKTTKEHQDGKEDPQSLGRGEARNQYGFKLIINNGNRATLINTFLPRNLCVANQPILGTNHRDSETPLPTHSFLESDYRICTNKMRKYTGEEAGTGSENKKSNPGVRKRIPRRQESRPTDRAGKRRRPSGSPLLSKPGLDSKSEANLVLWTRERQRRQGIEPKW